MKYISLAIACFILNACGNKDSDRDEGTPASYTSQETAANSSSSNLEEAMDILSDSDQENSNATALALTEPTRELTRTCVVEGATAKVNINASFEANLTKETRLGSVVQTFTKTADMTRIWSKEGSSVACNANGLYAEVTFAPVMTGTKTEITFNRKGERSVSTTLKNGTKVSRGVTTEVEGSRNVIWVSQTQGSGTSIVRSKIVSSTATRGKTETDRSGAKSDEESTVETLSAAPLAIDVTYPSAISTTASSRLIKSGTIKAATVGQGRIESDFQNLLVSFSDTGCQPESGKVVSRIYAEGVETPARIIQIEASAGVYVATDITDAANPAVIEDFDYQFCDVRNFNN